MLFRVSVIILQLLVALTAGSADLGIQQAIVMSSFDLWPLVIRDAGPLNSGSKLVVVFGNWETAGGPRGPFPGWMDAGKAAANIDASVVVPASGKGKLDAAESHTDLLARIHEAR